MVQCAGGTRVRAAAAVWSACIGTVGASAEVEEVVDVYGARSSCVVKKVELRLVNSSAVVYVLASARRRGAIYSDSVRP